MKIGHGALRMRCRLKNRPLVVLKYTQPGLKVAGVVGPRFEFRNDAEIGAQKAAPEFGDEFLSGSFAAVFVIARKIATHAMRWRRPVPVMPISA